MILAKLPFICWSPPWTQYCVPSVTNTRSIARSIAVQSAFNRLFNYPFNCLFNWIRICYPIEFLRVAQSSIASWVSDFGMVKTPWDAQESIWCLKFLWTIKTPWDAQDCGTLKTLWNFAWPSQLHGISNCPSILSTFCFNVQLPV